MHNSDSRINELRKSIDEIDEIILGLINKRLLFGKEIGNIKRKNNEQVTDKARETAILKRLKDLNKGHLRNDTLDHIFTQIISESREIQQPEKISYLEKGLACMVLCRWKTPMKGRLITRLIFFLNLI